ncbi:MAG: DUF2213 domain-containing protein [Azoarcus sp.]|jgi:hypothetical protein|nr:DUF2213 domain-containing protein [Azoarcus sp.]
MTHRIPDTNGWIEIKDNPLSKVGVFEYDGSSIGGEAEPGTVYGVLRAEAELSDPETVASARLLPWTNDHPDTLLGAQEDGRIPAEEKGVEGVTGEDTYYRDGVLYGNIKVFSQSLADDISSGKTELSMGYACQWVREDGTWEGKPYQWRQATIRFNHLSLVDRGRMGPDVAVLDSQPKGAKTMSDENENPDTGTKDAPDPNELLQSAIGAAKQLIEALQGIQSSLVGGGESPLASEEGAGPEESEVAAAEEVIAAASEDDPDPTAEEEAEDKDDPVSEEEKPSQGAQDAKDLPGDDLLRRTMRHLAVRDRLAEALKPHIGVFDHRDMTIDEVARYGAGKLRIKAGKGQELPALQGYLAAKRPPRPVSTAMDGRDKPSALTQYLNGEQQ